MKDLLAAVLAFLLAIKDALGGFMLGISLEQAKEAERGLDNYKTRQEVDEDVAALNGRDVREVLRNKWMRGVEGDTDK